MQKQSLRNLVVFLLLSMGILPVTDLMAEELYYYYGPFAPGNITVEWNTQELGFREANLMDITHHWITIGPEQAMSMGELYDLAITTSQKIDLNDQEKAKKVKQFKQQHLLMWTGFVPPGSNKFIRWVFATVPKSSVAEIPANEFDCP